MIVKLFVYLLISLIGLIVPIATLAKCGSGNPPNYDDIEAVMLAQEGHGGTIGLLTATPAPWQLRQRFDYSAYWVLFWKARPEDFSHGVCSV